MLFSFTVFKNFLLKFVSHGEVNAGPPILILGKRLFRCFAVTAYNSVNCSSVPCQQGFVPSAFLHSGSFGKINCYY